MDSLEVPSIRGPEINTFFCQAVGSWNGLPPSIKEIQSTTFITEYVSILSHLNECTENEPFSCEHNFRYVLVTPNVEYVIVLSNAIGKVIFSIVTSDGLRS